MGGRGFVLAVSLALLVVCSGSVRLTGQNQRAKKTSSVEFTIVHTTDVHGWIDAHPHQPKLNADYGDLASLVEHMKENAKKKGSEALFFDTGDLIEGTGLSDASKIHGQYIFPENINYDGLTVGNHDLGHYATVELIRSGFSPSWKGRYVTTNTLWAASGKTLGSYYYEFTTPNSGKKVLLMGFIYDFTQNANNTQIVFVKDAVEHSSFIDIIQKSVDVIVFLCHIDPVGQKENIQTLYNAVRKYHSTTPLIFLTGHAHQEVYEQLDESTLVLESYCYFQAVGVLRFTLTGEGTLSGISHSWVNTSVNNLAELAEVPQSQFLTPKGKQVKKQILNYFNELHLGELLGCSKITYEVDVDYRQSDSLYYLEINSVVPETVCKVVDHSLPGENYYITNTGFLRYPIFEGNVLLNDVYTTLPFEDKYVFFQELNGSVLQTLLDNLNNEEKEYQDLLLELYENRIHGVTMSTLPRWLWTDKTVDKGRSYNVLCAEYDSIAISYLLRKLFPEMKFQPIPYPTSENTTTSLKEYIKQYMKC